MIIGWSLPSAVIISLVEVEIWSILIFNVRIGIHMIILLQSVTVQFRKLFWHISYYKVRQSNFITKCDRLLLQSVSGVTKCDRLLLQSASGIIKCDSYYKVKRNTLDNLESLIKKPTFYKITIIRRVVIWSSQIDVAISNIVIYLRLVFLIFIF